MLHTTIDNMAIEIINNWIDYAGSRKFGTHSKHFWNARDILEGLFNSKEIVKNTIKFIKSLAETEQRNIVIKALEGK